MTNCKQMLGICLSLSLCAPILAQNVIISANPNASPHSSALLEVEASDGGLLIPQLTAIQRQILTSTATQGLWVFQTDEHAGLYLFQDSSWVRASSHKRIIGKVEVDVSDQSLVASYGPFSVVQDPIDSGQFDISFNPGSFGSPPSISMTAQAYPPPIDIGPHLYCPIEITDHCGTCPGSDFCHDQMEGVIGESFPNGTLNPSFGFSDLNTGCDNGYRNEFDNMTLIIDANPASFYRLTMNASARWQNRMFGYIDWNQNGIFDPQERVYDETDPSGQPFDALMPSGNLSAQSGALNGVTVLRCISTFFQPDDYVPCGIITFGEVHDYKVVVQNGTAPGPNDKQPLPAICNVTNVSQTGFRASCSGPSGASEGTSFHFYATEN